MSILTQDATFVAQHHRAPHTDAQNGAHKPESPSSSKLSVKHQSHLEESGIGQLAIKARGYFTVAADANGAATLSSLGFDSKQSKLGEALVIPLHNWRGEIVSHAMRPTIPRNNSKGKAQKYELPTGATNTLDVAVLSNKGIDDPTIDLLITEGAKKADAAASNGLVAISLNGVYGLRGKNAKGGITNLPELNEIPWKGAVGVKPISRRVFLAFDSDWEEKDGVYRALRQVAGSLEQRGATVKMVTLPPGPNGEKTGLDDFFARGGTKTDLFELAKDLVGVAEREKQKSEAKKAEKAKLIANEAKEREVSVIETNGRQLRSKLYDLSRAVEAMNRKTPQIFRGLDGLVYISHDALESATIKRVCRARMAAVAAEAAVWVSTTEREGASSVNPPRELCETYIVTEDYWTGIHSLERVADAPFFAPDGTLCDRTGYYESARAWLSLPRGFHLDDTTPTPENIAAARTLILETILGEVAFANEASKAHAVAQMILPFVRRMIHAPSPLHLWNAPLPGSGKSYTAGICIAPFTIPSPQVEKGNAEEWRKSLFTKLVSGPSVVFLDNIKGSLNSSMLDAAITAPSGYIEERLTGTGEMMKAPVWCVWVATANNAQLTSDAAKRSIVIEIDPNCENPDAREFKSDPAEFIRNNRAQVCTAILTLVRAWIEVGKPVYSGTNKCRFPAWRDVMGGILDVAEIPGFLDNIEESQDAVTGDSSDEWHEFTELWAAEHGDTRKTAKELLPTATQIPELAEALEYRAEGKGKEKALAQILARRLNQVFGDWKIVSGPKFQRKATYKLTPVQMPTTAEQKPHATSGSAYVTDAEDVITNKREKQHSSIPTVGDGMKNGQVSRSNGSTSSTSSTYAHQGKNGLFDSAPDQGVDI